MTEANVPFSQRNGLVPIPPQLKLNEVSAELRRLIYFAIYKDLQASTTSGYESSFLNDRWKALAENIHVRFLKQWPDTFRSDPGSVRHIINSIVQNEPVGRLFDFVEFVLDSPNLGCGAKSGLISAFVEARAAYRVYDGQLIAAIGTEEQAQAFERAIADAEAKSAVGARKHLLDAGVALRNGDWAGSVRESIHAVESVAVMLAPGKDTLGDALKVVEKAGHLHGGLKAAFVSLYGYSSDEKGVRHAKVFDQAGAQVDEADALFMLGACASFVSYLFARTLARP